jgi:hypothetical protein
MQGYLIRNGPLNVGMGLVVGTLGGTLVGTSGSPSWRWRRAATAEDGTTARL